jgi:hypothetical protein
MSYYDLTLNTYLKSGVKPRQRGTKPVNGHGVHVIFIAHTGVWHSSAWERWAMDSPGTRLLLHQEKAHKFPFSTRDLADREAFRDKYNVPPKFRVLTKYGGISVVEAIVNSISYALTDAPELSTFSIVSGDSFPIQHANALKSHESVIAIQEIKRERKGEFKNGVVLHNMDMLLNRVDAETLVTDFPKWKEAIIRYAETNKTNADEFAIGTILHHSKRHAEPKRFQMAGWLVKTVSANEPLTSFPIDLSLTTPLHNDTLEFPIPRDTTKHGIAPADTTGLDVAEDLLARAWPFNEFYWFRKLLPTPGVTDVRLWSKWSVGGVV